MSAAAIGPAILNIRQFIFLSGETSASEESDTVIIPEALWHDLLPLYKEGQPMLVDVLNNVNGHERVVCLGEPHREDDKTIFAPTWVIDNLGCDLDTPVSVKPHLEAPPPATLLVLRPMDSAIYSTDVRDLFERALDSFRVLQQGAMLTVHVDEMGDYPVSAYVERTEPAALVRLGGEVRVEFLEPEGGVEEFVAAAAAAAEKAIAALGNAFSVAPVAESTQQPAQQQQQPAQQTTEEEKERIRQARLQYFMNKLSPASSEA